MSRRTIGNDVGIDGAALAQRKPPCTSFRTTGVRSALPIAEPPPTTTQLGEGVTSCNGAARAIVLGVSGTVH